MRERLQSTGQCDADLHAQARAHRCWKETTQFLIYVTIGGLRQLL